MKADLKLIWLKPKTALALECLSKLLSRVSNACLSGGAISAATALLTDTRLSVYVPIGVGAIGFFSQSLNEWISTVLTRSEIRFDTTLPPDAEAGQR